MSKGRLVILCGPSCVGKSPLFKLLARFHPQMHAALQPVVLYNDRDPRPGELDGVDYYFRTTTEIEAMRDDADKVVMDVRGDLQALDIAELKQLLESGDVIFEGNPFVGSVLNSDPRLDGLSRTAVFMTPLSRDEVLYLKSEAGPDRLPGIVTDIMRRKLLRRTRKQKSELSLKDLENIETRAGHAYRELKMAHEFASVLPNHAGEDSENWDAFYYPVGDAWAAMQAFVSALRGEEASLLESWEPDLLP